MLGKLACKIPLHPDSLGLPIEIQFGSANHRPKFFLPAETVHLLAIEQREGIDQERYLKIVAVVAGLLP
jgi:hypothetical protein